MNNALRSYSAVRALNAVHFIATRSALNAVAAACYITTVVILIYAIALHVRLESWVERLATGSLPMAASPSAPGDSALCSDEQGLQRGLCKADFKVDTAKAKLKQRITKRKSPQAGPVQETLPQLLPVSETLVWTPERADDTLGSRSLANMASQPSEINSAPPMNARASEKTPTLASR